MPVRDSNFKAGDLFTSYFENDCLQLPRHCMISMGLALPPDFTQADCIFPGAVYRKIIWILGISCSHFFFFLIIFIVIQYTERYSFTSNTGLERYHFVCIYYQGLYHFQYCTTMYGIFGQ